MSYEEYWYGETSLVWDYIEADKVRQERENAMAWWQGVYVYNALTSALSVCELFRAKGHKPTPYPKQPYDLFPKEKTPEEKEREEEAQRLRAIAYFDSLIAHNKQRRGE